MLTESEIDNAFRRTAQMESSFLAAAKLASGAQTAFGSLKGIGQMSAAAQTLNRIGLPSSAAAQALNLKGIGKQFAAAEALETIVTAQDRIAQTFVGQSRLGEAATAFGRMKLPGMKLTGSAIDALSNIDTGIGRRMAEAMRFKMPDTDFLSNLAAARPMDVAPITVPFDRLEAPAVRTARNSELIVELLELREARSEARDEAASRDRRRHRRREWVIAVSASLISGGSAVALTQIFG